MIKKQRKRRAFVPETPSFLVGKGKLPTTPDAITLNGARSVSLSQPVNGFKPESRDVHERPVSSSSVPRIVGDGTRDSPIALLDDGDVKMEDGTRQGADVKRVKLANGSSAGIAPSPSISHATPVKAENGEASRKRKHSSVGTEVC